MRRYTTCAAAVIFLFFLVGCVKTDISEEQTPTPSVTASPTPAPTGTRDVTGTPVPTPDINGINGNTGYVNEALGLSVPYPEGYTALTKDEIESLMAQTIDYIKEIYENSGDVEQILSQNVPKAMAFKHSMTYTQGFNPSINFIVYELPQGSPSDIMTIAANAVQEANSQVPSLNYSDPISVKLSDIDAVSVDLTQTVQEYDITQRQYFFLRNSNLVIVTLSADNNDDLNELDNAVKAIKFS